MIIKIGRDYKLIKVETARTIKNSGKTEHNTRYYISSKKANAEVLNDNIRSHWAIENNYYYTLRGEPMLEVWNQLYHRLLIYLHY
ncbi:MAG: hypothetical protein HC819_19270 [Cyclobacteriaceae bacterium]|nr:hypothetical protein [Cyclobacteriaceae bacterium]